MKAVFIFGAQGMLGQEIFSACEALPDINVIPLAAFNYDIAEKTEIERAFEEMKPSIVINAAALTDVDACERPENKEYATQVNALAPETMANLCKASGARFVHISTDYVFDGMEKSYSENSTPNPINHYGKSKLLGEQRVMTANPNALIIRTARVFGKGRKNLITDFDFLARKGKPVKAIDDEWGNFTYARDIAERLTQMLIDQEGLSGIMHLSGKEIASPYEIAAEIIALRKSSAELIPISADSLQRLAPRPKRVKLVSERVPMLPPFSESLPRFFGIPK